MIPTSIDLDLELAIEEFRRRLSHVDHGAVSCSVEKHAGLAIRHSFANSPYTTDDLDQTMRGRPTRRGR